MSVGGKRGHCHRHTDGPVNLPSQAGGWAGRACMPSSRIRHDCIIIMLVVCGNCELKDRAGLGTHRWACTCYPPFSGGRSSGCGENACTHHEGECGKPASCRGHCHRHTDGPLYNYSSAVQYVCVCARARVCAGEGGQAIREGEEGLKAKVQK